MKQQRWEESKKIKEEKRRAEKKNNQKKEYGTARHVEEIAKLYFWCCGSKSSPAKAAGAETSGSSKTSSTSRHIHLFSVTVIQVGHTIRYRLS